MSLLLLQVLLDIRILLAHLKNWARLFAATSGCLRKELLIACLSDSARAQAESALLEFVLVWLLLEELLLLAGSCLGEVPCTGPCSL